MYELQSAVISKINSDSKHFHYLLATMKMLHFNFSYILDFENSKTIRIWVNQMQLSVVSC